MRITRIVCGTAVVLLSAASVLAQDRKPIPRGEMDKYVISAKAGVVNLVEGDVRVTRARPFAIPEILLSGDELQGGDTVKTGTTGRAEILLNPGCFLRLGTESEFVFMFDNVTSERLKLVRGSAVLEASAIDGAIVVETPKSRFEIARDGLYRFNVSPDGKADVAVRKGRVLVGGSTIKGGKHALVDGGTAAIAKLNKQDADVLDEWSRDRSKALIAANSRLSNAGMSRTLGISFIRNSWIYDPFCRCYTFLPFVGGFSSPYGWGYSVCNPYGSSYYYRPRNNSGGSWAGGNGGGTHSGGSNGSGSGGRAVGGGPVGGGSRPGGGGAVSPPSYRPPSMGGGASDRGSARETAGPRRSRP
jgi:FecR protein